LTDTIWRIEKAKRVAMVKSGEGARIAGGRWNSAGRPVIYCAEHLSLAILEVLVHAPDPSQRLVARVRFRLRVAAALVERVPDARLPAAFSPRTPYAATQRIGDEWLKAGRTPALAVPSAIVPSERNYMLNPLHVDFSRIAWDPPERIALDNRLWMTGS
jgi:RES domain-containing protein